MLLKDVLKKERERVRKLAKYKEGTWVKFRTGKRTLRGVIRGRYLNIGNTVIYEIVRNKQTFHSIPERNILEIVK